MNPKTENEFFDYMHRLIGKKLKNESFQFDVPSHFEWNIWSNELPDKVLKALPHYYKVCRKVLKLAKSFHVGHGSIADLAQTVIDLFPLPLPEVQVHRNHDIIRYRATVAVHPAGFLLSLRLITSSEDLGDLAGVNQSKLETALVASVRAMMNRQVQGMTFIYDRRIDIAENILENRWYCGDFDEAAVAEAVSRIPDAILFGILHAVLAMLVPLMKPDRRPLYVPALRLMKDKKDADRQRAILGNVLGSFALARDPESDFPFALQLTIQDTEGLKTLRQIEGLPVLVQLTKPKMNAALTEMLQRAQCSIAASGREPCPLRTVPILAGGHLPPEHVALVLDWDMIETVKPEDIALLRGEVENLMERPKDVAKQFSRGCTYFTLDGRNYPDAYFLQMVHVFAKLLFWQEAHQQALIERAERILGLVQVQQDRQLTRMEQAITILQDFDGYRDLIAESAKEMKAEQLGFMYKKRNNEEYIAFEKKADFPAFCEAKLGLRPDDAGEFCKFLHRQEAVEKLSEKARGRTGESQSHVLIRLEFCCPTEKNQEDT